MGEDLAQRSMLIVAVATRHCADLADVIWSVTSGLQINDADANDRHFSDSFTLPLAMNRDKWPFVRKLRS